MSEPYIVAVVLDPDFGDRLRGLSAGMPVWIAEIPSNRVAAEAAWASRPVGTHLDGVTTFRVDRSLTPEAWLVDILPTVDLHHGDYSHDPPYAGVAVFGANPTPEVRAALVEFGLVNVVERPGGFLATRSPAAGR